MTATRFYSPKTCRKRNKIQQIRRCTHIEDVWGLILHALHDRAVRSK